MTHMIGGVRDLKMDRFGHLHCLPSSCYSVLNMFVCWRSQYVLQYFFFFSSRRRHTRFDCDWSSDVCSSDLAGRLPGVAVSLDSIVPATPDAERLIAQANAAVLSGTMSENTKQVIRRQISDISDPLQARALAIGLAIGGPEFQRQ